MLWFKNELLESTLDNEGFESKPYIDTLVNQAPEQHGIPPDELKIIKKHLDKLKLTFGYGLTYINKDEAKAVTDMRLKELKKQIKKEYPHVKKCQVLNILTEMSFQLGLRGLKGFKNMHKAIEAKDYKEASKHGLDSLWAKIQTPNRAKRLMDKLAQV